MRPVGASYVGGRLPSAVASSVWCRGGRPAPRQRAAGPRTWGTFRAVPHHPHRAMHPSFAAPDTRHAHGREIPAPGRPATTSRSSRRCSRRGLTGQACGRVGRGLRRVAGQGLGSLVHAFVHLVRRERCRAGPDPEPGLCAGAARRPARGRAARIASTSQRPCRGTLPRAAVRAGSYRVRTTRGRRDPNMVCRRPQAAHRMSTARPGTIGADGVDRGTIRKCMCACRAAPWSSRSSPDRVSAACVCTRATTSPPCSRPRASFSPSRCSRTARSGRDPNGTRAAWRHDATQAAAPPERYISAGALVDRHAAA